MKKENLLPVIDISRHYKVKVAFIRSLKDYDLIEITTVRKKDFIPASQLHRLEKLMRLHYDLNVNMEGIDVIHHLLDRVETLQQEMISLKNRIRRFESE